MGQYTVILIAFFIKIQKYGSFKRKLRISLFLNVFYTIITNIIMSRNKFDYTPSTNLKKKFHSSLYHYVTFLSFRVNCESNVNLHKILFRLICPGICLWLKNFTMQILPTSRCSIKLTFCKSVDKKK